MSMWKKVLAAALITEACFVVFCLVVGFNLKDALVAHLSVMLVAALTSYLSLTRYRGDGIAWRFLHLLAISFVISFLLTGVYWLAVLIPTSNSILDWLGDALFHQLLIWFMMGGMVWAAIAIVPCLLTAILLHYWKNEDDDEAVGQRKISTIAKFGIVAVLILAGILAFSGLQYQFGKGPSHYSVEGVHLEKDLQADSLQPDSSHYRITYEAMTANVIRGYHGTPWSYGCADSVVEIRFESRAHKCLNEFIKPDIEHLRHLLQHDGRAGIAGGDATVIALPKNCPQPRYVIVGFPDREIRDTLIQYPIH